MEQRIVDEQKYIINGNEKKLEDMNVRDGIFFLPLTSFAQMVGNFLLRFDTITRHRVQYVLNGFPAGIHQLSRQANA